MKLWLSKKWYGKEYNELTPNQKFNLNSAIWIGIVIGLLAILVGIIFIVVNMTQNDGEDVSSDLDLPKIAESVIPVPSCNSNFSKSDWNNTDLFIREKATNIFSFDSTNPKSEKGAIMFFNKKYFSGNYSVKFDYKSIVNDQKENISKNIILQVDDQYRIIIGNGNINTLVLEKKIQGKWETALDRKDNKIQKLTNGIAPNQIVSVILQQTVINDSMSEAVIFITLKYFPIENPNSPSVQPPAIEYLISDLDFKAEVQIGVGIIEDPNLQFEFISFKCDDSNY